MKMTLQRKFVPGDKWLFFKIYVAPNESNRVLLACIRPFVESLTRRKNIDCWFFIRYSDPDYHIRLRLRLSDIKYIGDAVNGLFIRLKRFLDTGIVSKVMLDTYIREVERYGMDTMEKCEDFFCQDSIVSLNIIDSCVGKGLDWDWRIGLIRIDAILKQFLPDLGKRLKIVVDISDNYNREFGYDSHNLKQINSLYRKYRQEVETILSVNSNFLNISSISEMSIDLDLLNSSNALQILPSLLHMSMNRMYPMKQRLYEMLIYNFIRAYYKGCLAKLRK